MKKVTDLKGNEVIHCKTQEEWDKILALNPKNKVLSDSWNNYKSESIYNPIWDNWKGGYSKLKTHQYNDNTIYPASDFLEEEFKYGEEIEARDSPTCQWICETFVGINPFENDLCKKYITVDKDGDVTAWKYARKIQTKPIPEYTIEELQKKLGEEFKIVKSK